MKLTIFGESHGKAIGMVLEGVPTGIQLDLEQIEQDMERRRPGKFPWTSPRQEMDKVEVVSGFYQGFTTGAPLCGMIKNNDMRSADYQTWDGVPRPGHADYTGWVRYQGFADNRGGGHFSGRLTAPLVFAGAIAKQILNTYNITCGAHILKIAEVNDKPFDFCQVSHAELRNLAKMDFPLLQIEQETDMIAAIMQASTEQDSIGGVIECAVAGIEAGYGSPGMGSVEGLISRYCFAIPAVKGIEFGSGFALVQMRGTQVNDPFYQENGQIKTRSNHNGGINGGITNGMPVVFRVAIKPTPSISSPQESVNLKTGESVQLSVPGRHDPCIVPRAVAVVEAAAALAICELILPFNGHTGGGYGVD